MSFRSVHVAQPSFLLGDRADRRIRERLGIYAAALVQPFLLGKLRIYRSIEARTICRAMVSTAIAAKAGRFVYHFDELQQLERILSE